MSLIFNKELLIIVAEIPKKTIEAEVYTDVYTDVYTRRNILDRGFTFKMIWARISEEIRALVITR